MSLIAFLYFENQQKLYFNLTKSKMKNIASIISSKIIYAHMSGTKLAVTGSFESKNYKLAFYDETGKKIFGNIEEEIDLTKDIIEEKENFILVDRSTFGHLGISAIAIKEHLYFKQIKRLEINIILLFFLIYSIIAIVGFYLAKLFIKPIKEERDKLNNFIKDTTHELNTPISAILMSTESEELNSKQIERIRLSAKRVSEIYKDLTYVFLQKDVEQKDLKEISLVEIIDEQLKYFEPLATKKRIKITLDLEEFSYKIVKDEFIRLFNNLLSNAIKYNKMNGEITIVLKDNKLIIKDTGIGIKKSEMADIFKRYYRATSLQGGFGLGLNIVSQICKKYNIKIEIDSILNEGTEIRVLF
ncbi:sensor histidine kinase [Arcobacter sp.]|uniref:sensor histidine kinase n=2 Tax=Arcobacter sp. TaxID=1872629 RepID=UPI003D11DBBF